MLQNNHIIIFSHGFGVKKDDMGLFTDIADSLKDIKSVLIDYNDIDEEKNQVTVKPFSLQAETLKKTLDDIKTSNPDAVVDIICHSQGAIIVAVAKPAGIRRIIFISPPIDLNIDRMISRFESRPGTKINMQGISKVSRSDGSATIIPSEYWAEREKIWPIELYNQLAKISELIIINAKQDDVLDNNDFSSLDNTEVIKLDGDHNFSGDNRKKLLELIAGKVKL